MERAILRQELEHACRVLRKPRKTATPRALATACSLPLEAMRIVLKTLQEQPYITSVRNDKGAWLSYTFTNYAPRLVHMSFCAVVCEGTLVEGSESPAAPMFDAPTQLALRQRYQRLALENGWVYLDVTSDHMAHLLQTLENALRGQGCTAP